MIRVLLDTNVLRYFGNKRDSRLDQNYQLIKPFWDDVEDNRTKYHLCIAEETKRELQVQLPVIQRQSEKVAKAISELLLDLNVVPTPYDDVMEHELRLVASYLKTTYQSRTPKGIEMNYPKIPDVRIILTAYKEDLRLVTKDIRDFMLFTCLDGVLWDPETNSEVVLDDHTYQKVQADMQVKELIQDLALIRTPY